MRQGVWSVLAAAGLAMVSVPALASAPGKPQGPVAPGVDPDQGAVYQGHSVVRVAPNTNRHLLATLNLAESIWSERVGLGSFDIQVSAEARGALDELGIRYDVLIEDVQALVDAERVRLAAQPAFVVDRDAPHDPAFYDDYKTSDQIDAYLGALVANRPGVATSFVAGQTVQGQDIIAYEISGPDAPGNARADRPVILWQFNAHAREWVSPMTGAFLTDQLIEQYGQDRRVTDLLDQLRIVTVPVLNVDGYDYSWTSGQRLWRKNRRNNGNGTFGVDLNRNFAHQWGGTGSSGSTSSDIYRGPAPFSEPETQAMRDLFEVTYPGQVVAHIDYHNYSQLILWPWGYTVADVPEPDRTFFEDLSVSMSQEILSAGGVFYDPIQSADLYEAAGDASDWFYNAGAMSLTIELRDTGASGFLLPASQIRPTAEEMWAASLLFAETAGLPARAAFDAVPSVVEAGDITLVPVTLSDGREQIDLSTVRVWRRVGDDTFDDSPLVVSQDGRFAPLPSAACGETIEFYLEAQTVQGSTLRSPLAGAAAPYSTDAVETLPGFSDDMETDTGWTVGAPTDTATTGVWTRMDPEPTAAQPGDDRTPAGTQAWITDGRGGSVGTYDIDGGATTLTSPALDALAEPGDATLTYWRWYSNDQGANPNTDTMLVEISADNGNSWTTLETVSDNANAWVFREFNIADFVTPTSTVRVRFIASDLGAGSIVEAGVDDLALVFRGCGAGYSPDLAPPFGVLDFFDVLEYLAQFDAADPAADLAAPFGTFDFFDVLEYLAAFDAG